MMMQDVVQKRGRGRPRKNTLENAGAKSLNASTNGVSLPSLFITRNTQDSKSGVGRRELRVGTHGGAGNRSQGLCVLPYDTGSHCDNDRIGIGVAYAEVYGSERQGSQSFVPRASKKFSNDASLAAAARIGQTCVGGFTRRCVVIMYNKHENDLVYKPQAVTSIYAITLPQKDWDYLGLLLFEPIYSLTLGVQGPNSGSAIPNPVVNSGLFNPKSIDEDSIHLYRVAHFAYFVTYGYEKYVETLKREGRQSFLSQSITELFDSDGQRLELLCNQTWVKENTYPHIFHTIAVNESYFGNSRDGRYAYPLTSGKRSPSLQVNLAHKPAPKKRKADMSTEPLSAPLSKPPPPYHNADTTTRSEVAECNRARESTLLVSESYSLQTRSSDIPTEPSGTRTSLYSIEPPQPTPL